MTVQISKIFTVKVTSDRSLSKTFQQQTWVASILVKARLVWWLSNNSSPIYNFNFDKHPPYRSHKFHTRFKTKKKLSFRWTGTDYVTKIGNKNSENRLKTLIHKGIDQNKTNILPVLQWYVHPQMANTQEGTG